jgi:4-hydroxy-tetrahydrodipicolinate synthase
MRKSDSRITKSDIRGIVVPMITPFKGRDGSLLDVAALERLTNYLIENGVHGLMPLGTSGEFALLNRDERQTVIQTVARSSRKRVPVIAGISTPGTRDAVLYGKDAASAGADVLISTGPYYYRTSPEGLYNHYQTIIDEVDLPLMIYNIPGWAGYNIPPKIAKKLSDNNHGKLIGVKFTTNDMELFLEYLRLLRDEMSIMIGADSLILTALEMGAAGAVVGSANVLPEITSSIYENFTVGNMKEAQALQAKLDPFTVAMNLGTYPASLKTALDIIGLPCGLVRPPLMNLESGDAERVRKSISWKASQIRSAGKRSH